MNLTTHDELKLYYGLRKEADAAGLFVIEKDREFLLFRQMPDRNVVIAKPRTLEGLKRAVCRAAGKH